MRWLVGLAVMLVSCASQPPSTATSAIDSKAAQGDRERATAIATGCATGAPYNGKVNGRALDLGAATVWYRTGSNAGWLVHFPEVKRIQEPDGLELVVNLATETCVVQPQE